ncbi:hypothetical protein [Gemmata sp.]|uniref:hypothetical protein n=1 Tax=Gemmata sp. TaxID=1914242 RepID=UPI003F71EE6D
MTREQWFAATNPDPLVRAVHDEWFAAFGNVGQRLRYDVAARQRLFACAAARMVWDVLPTDARSAVLMSERVAGSEINAAELPTVRLRLDYGAVTFQQLAFNAAGWASAGAYEAGRFMRGHDSTTLYDPMEAARSAAKSLATRATGPAPLRHTLKTSAWHAAWTGVYNEARATQAHYVRDIFPPPNYAPRFDTAWLTSTVVALSRQMDESGDLSIVPILADALEDAGCDDVTLLQCCREPGGVHVRGNWVVDLVLGRG